MRRSPTAPGGLGRHAVSWLPLIAYSVAIFCVSSIPLGTLQSLGFSLNDKLLHLQIYGLWGLLGGWGVLRTWPVLAGPAVVLLVGAGGLFYGVSDELHQTFVPGRAAELGDLAADLMGSVLGAAAIVAARSRIPRLRRARAEAPTAREPAPEDASIRDP